MSDPSDTSDVRPPTPRAGETWANEEARRRVILRVDGDRVHVVDPADNRHFDVGITFAALEWVRVNIPDQDVRVNERVVDRHRFGAPGVVVGACDPWLWIVWDEYTPADHEPSTHHKSSVRRLT